MEGLASWIKWWLRKEKPDLCGFKNPCWATTGPPSILRLVVTLGAQGMLEGAMSQRPGAQASTTASSLASWWLWGKHQDLRWQVWTPCAGPSPSSCSLYLQPQVFIPYFGGNWKAMSYRAELLRYLHTLRVYVMHNKSISWQSFSNVLLTKSFQTSYALGILLLHSESLSSLINTSNVSFFPISKMIIVQSELFIMSPSSSNVAFAWLHLK